MFKRYALYSRSFWLIFFGSLSHAAHAQGEYGLKLGAAYYRPLQDVAVLNPSAGLELGVSSKFQLSDSGRWRLMPEFGYLMSHSPALIAPQLDFTGYAGFRITDIQSINVLSHFLTFGLLAKYNFTEEDKFGFYFGPQAHYIVNQTFIVNYTAPGGTPDQTIQEIFGGLQGNAPRWYWNVLLGAEMWVLRTNRNHFVLYGHTIHQFNQLPYIPAGGVVGLKLYFGPHFGRSSPSN
jgi:hypothetical protein